MNKEKSLLKSLSCCIKNQGWLFILFLCVLVTILTPVHVYVKDIFCLLVLFPLVSKYADKDTIWIILFSCSYYIIEYFNGIVNSNFESFSHLVCPLTFFLLGKRIVSKSRDIYEIECCVLLIAMFATLYLFIESVLDAFQYGVIKIMRNLGSGETETMSATILGLIASLGIACISITLTNRKKNKGLFFLSFVITLLALFSIIHLVTRTGLFVLAITFICVIVYLSKSNFKDVIIVIVTFVLLYYLLVALGIINEELVQIYADREQNYDYSIATGGGRFERWNLALNYLFSYPVGWQKTLYSVSYVHNLWLDIARSVGLIPFLLMIYISVLNYRITFSLFKINGDDIISILIGFNSCMFASAFVEPVLEGVSTYFYLIFLIWGIQKQYSSSLITGMAKMERLV